MRQTEMKLIGITIVQKLKVDIKHVNSLCKNTARQINIMYRFQGIFDLKAREIFYSTFFLAHCKYYPSVGYFC